MAHTLKIDGEGTAITREITDAQLVQIMNLLVGGAQEGMSRNSSTAADAGSDQMGDDPAERVSLAEFLGRVNAKTHATRIAAFVWYSKEHGGKDSLHRDEIPTYFRNAALKVPSNVRRDIRTAVKDELIAADLDDPDRFYVTTNGRNQLETGASGGSFSTSSNKRSGSSSRTSETYDPVDLDLTREERQAFKEFYAEKNPSSQNEHVLTVMYWLLENCERAHVSRSEIVTGLRHVKERIPVRLTSVLSNLRLAGKITGKGDELNLHHTGRDLVEHDLPAKN